MTRVRGCCQGGREGGKEGGRGWRYASNPTPSCDVLPQKQRSEEERWDEYVANIITDPILKQFNWDYIESNAPRWSELAQWPTELSKHEEKSGQKWDVLTMINSDRKLRQHEVDGKKSAERENTWKKWRASGNQKHALLRGKSKSASSSGREREGEERNGEQKI